MSKLKKLLIAAFLVVSAMILAPTSKAEITIEVGDRGYYTHGSSYWSHGVEWYWVPGHWGHHHHWIHGHYVRRGVGVAVPVPVPVVRVHHWW
jgi:hypothetical protein